MINLKKIQYNEPIYYVPSYTGVCKVSILHKLSGDTPMMLVKPYSKKKDFKAFPMPLEFVFVNEDDAKRYENVNPGSVKPTKLFRREGVGREPFLKGSLLTN